MDWDIIIGIVVGLIFSLCLFWVKECISSRRRKKHLKANTTYEFDYNTYLFQLFVADLTECLEKIALDEKDVYSRVNYDNFAYFFFREFYHEGLASESFTYVDTRLWNEIVTSSSQGSEKYLEDSLQDWRDSKIDKQTISKVVQHERVILNRSIDMMKYLKAKIN